MPTSWGLPIYIYIYIYIEVCVCVSVCVCVCERASVCARMYVCVINLRVGVGVSLSVSVCLCLCLCPCLCLCLCVFVSPWVYLSLSLSFSVRVCMCVSVCLHVCSCVYICVCVCVCLCVSLFVHAKVFQISVRRMVTGAISWVQLRPPHGTNMVRTQKGHAMPQPSRATNDRPLAHDAHNYWLAPAALSLSLSPPQTYVRGDSTICPCRPGRCIWLAQACCGVLGRTRAHCSTSKPSMSSCIACTYVFLLSTDVSISNAPQVFMDINLHHFTKSVACVQDLCPHRCKIALCGPDLLCLATVPPDIFTYWLFNYSI